MIPLAEARALADTRERDALWDEPRAGTLLEILRRPAARYPDRPALFMSSDARTCEAFSWLALWEGALARAARFAEAGCRPGDRVILAVPTSSQFFTSFFGVLAAGAVPVPIAPPSSLNPARLAWYRDFVAQVTRDSGAALLVTTGRYEAVLTACAEASPARPRIVAADAAEPAPAFAVAARPAGTPAIIQYTSGSTGSPKGVVLSEPNVLSNMAAIAPQLAHRDSYSVSWLPLHHDMGLIGAALSGLYTRTPLLFLPPARFVKEPAAWLRAISAFGATIAIAPNFAYAHAAQHVQDDEIEGLSLASLRTALTGAEPVVPAAVAAFESRFARLGLRRGVVRPAYGLAENTLAVTFSAEGEWLVDAVGADALEERGVAVPAATGRISRFVSVGRPIGPQEIAIVDEHDRALPERTVGQVVVRGPSVMQGYFNRPEETAAALRSGWLHTGDLGYLAEGRLYVTGRLKDLIIRYGRNYHPADIEAVIAAAPGVLRGGAAVFAVDHQGDSRVIALIETRLRAPGELARLQRSIRAHWQEAFLFGPDDVRFVPGGRIPRTTSGKIRRLECRRLYLAGAFPPALPAADPPCLSIGAGELVLTQDG